MNVHVDGVAAGLIALAVAATLYVAVRHGVLIRYRHDPKDDDETPDDAPGAY